MGRPKKDNAEYFPHAVQMRNDEKIKAIRRRFKLQGYAIWNMLIEYMAGKEHFQFEYNELTLELIAGDFESDPKDIQEIISYCLTLDLLQQEDGIVRCKTLVKKLEPLLSKRKRDRNRVIAGENPQSKVKKSKGEIVYQTFGEGDLSVVVRKKYVHDKHKKIFDLQEYFKHTEQLNDLLKSNFDKFRAFIEANPGRLFNDDDHLYSSFKKFCIDNPNTQARSPDNPFAEAEHNKKQWTDQAWREKYQRQIQNNPSFRKHFQITQ